MQRSELQFCLSKELHTRWLSPFSMRVYISVEEKAWGQHHSTAAPQSAQSHTGALVRVLAASLVIQHPADMPGAWVFATRMGASAAVLGSCPQPLQPFKERASGR